VTRSFRPFALYESQPLLNFKGTNFALCLASIRASTSRSISAVASFFHPMVLDRGDWSGIKIIRPLRVHSLRIFHTPRGKCTGLIQYGAQDCATGIVPAEVDLLRLGLRSSVKGSAPWKVCRHRRFTERRVHIPMARAQKTLRSDAGLVGRWKPCVASGRLTAIPRFAVPPVRPGSQFIVRDRQLHDGLPRRCRRH